MIICKWSEINRYSSVIPGLQEAVDFVANLSHRETGTYPLKSGKVMLQKGVTHPLEGAKAEAHKKYLDIQLVLEGSEYCGWENTDSLKLVGEFDYDKDVGFYEGTMKPFEITSGMCYVLYPEDAHAPCTHLTAPTEYTKLVIKLEL